MKIPLLYGFLMAVVGALLTFGMFFAGMHDTPEKMASGRWIVLCIGTPVTIALLALAIGARRKVQPADKEWTYGSALWAGVQTAFWATVFGTICMYVYTALVNPNYSEMLYQMQVQAMQAKGMTDEQISRAEGIMKTMFSPGIQAVFQLVFSMVIMTAISLIVAIFFRKPIVRSQPELSAAGTPPAL